ncbi:effector-associated constant component EACC1 [Streptomyces alanosinicus]|uniref:Uncharacterized protein n=1 Tax=Streptomyces alanosinicus TaxID=68171 RepID=A0A919D1L2_9ACTN|nr:hypothetical protein [Streptomyces alanosinicus]GHE02298.1 hypothetical protein GCM10010339_24890 [Streptomyces alanosinicus]
MTDFVVALPAPAGVPGAAAGHPGTEDDLRSLLRWLRDDESLAVRGQAGSSAPPAPGGMGAGFDILQLALGAGLSAGSLVVSVLQWQAARRQAPAVTLRRGEVEVLLTAQTARDEETVRRIVELLDGTSPQGGLPHPRTEEPGGDGVTA